MTHRRTKIHSLNLKILNQDDVISSKSRATFQFSLLQLLLTVPCSHLEASGVQNPATASSEEECSQA